MNGLQGHAGAFGLWPPITPDTSIPTAMPNPATADSAEGTQLRSHGVLTHGELEARQHIRNGIPTRNAIPPPLPGALLPSAERTLAPLYLWERGWG